MADALVTVLDGKAQVAVEAADLLAPMLADAQAASGTAAASASLAVGSASSLSTLLYVDPISIDPASASDTGDGASTDNATLFMEGTFGDGATLVDTLVIYAAQAEDACTFRHWQQNADGSVSHVALLATKPLVDGINTFSAPADFVAFVAIPGTRLSAYSASGGLCKRGGTGAQTGTYIPGDASGTGMATLYAGFSLMMSAAGKTGNIGVKVAAASTSALLGQYPLALDFDPAHIGPGQSPGTDNVTMLAGSTFCQMGLGATGALSAVRIRTEAAVTGAVLSIYEKLPSGHYSFVRDLWTGNLPASTITTLSAGTDFDLSEVTASQTIGIWAMGAGIARSTDIRGDQDAPIFFGKYRGSDTAPGYRQTPVMLAATLMVADESSDAPVYRLTTFYEDASAATPALQTGQLAVYEGPDGLTFPVRRPVSYSGLPAGCYVRDPDVRRDAGLKAFFLCHSSHAFGGGAPGAIFDVAFSRDGLAYTHLASIDVGVLLPGASTAWAPQWFEDSDGHVYILVSTQINGGSHVMQVLRSIDPMHRAFEYVGALTGAQIPASAIDAQIVRSGGRYVLICKDETATTLFAAHSASLLGPYDTAIDLGLAGLNPIEGPDLVVMPDRLRLYYDRYTGVRMRAVDYAFLGAAPSAELAVDTGHQTPAVHGAVMRIG